jgi:hypothetical protein
VEQAIWWRAFKLGKINHPFTDKNTIALAFKYRLVFGSADYEVGRTACVNTQRTKVVNAVEHPLTATEPVWTCGTIREIDVGGVDGAIKVDPGPMDPYPMTKGDLTLLENDELKRVRILERAVDGKNPTQNSRKRAIKEIKNRQAERSTTPTHDILYANVLKAGFTEGTAQMSCLSSLINTHSSTLFNLKQVTTSLRSKF